MVEKLHHGAKLNVHRMGRKTGPVVRLDAAPPARGSTARHRQQHFSKRKVKWESVNMYFS
jgi:hypothetical protein